jgi:hypothetical protein
MFVRWRRLGWRLLCVIPSDQATEIVAIGTVSLEKLFIKEALYTATGTYLI